jgi:hypothetical protein
LAQAVGESRLAIGAIGVMVRIDVARSDAFAGKPRSYRYSGALVGARLAREEALKA